MNVAPRGVEQRQILRMAVSISQGIRQQQSGCQSAEGLVLMAARYMVADSPCDPFPSLACPMFCERTHLRWSSGADAESDRRAYAGVPADSC